MAPVRTVISMRWCDMDAFGHVNNVTFLEYYETARVELLADMALFDGGTVSVVVGRHEVDYLRPLIYGPRDIAVDTTVDRIGDTSATLAYTVGEPDGSVIYSKAKTVVVFVDAAAGRPCPVPDQVRERLTQYAAE